MIPSSAIPVGETLAGRYRLDAALGKGAMGEVFRGHDLELGRDVAVKLMAGVEGGDDTRLLHEARAAASLNHPGLVAIYDVGRQGGAPFLVMELVEGHDVRARPPRDLDGIARMALQVLEALAHAHGNGVVHRDLKPANILVTGSEGAPHYKLTDFGLALSRGSSGMTQQGMVVGTAAYLAPEQALGRPVDGRADLYALGVVLYELAAGRLPFDDRDVLTMISQHIHAPVTPPRTFRSDLSPDFERVILRSLAKDPDQRFQTAEEVARAITQALAGMSQTDALATQAMPVATPGAGGLLDQLVRGRLVGRAPELDQLRGMWERALQGHGHLALVSGEPGAGKTRLARELLVQAQVVGAVVLRGACYEYEATTPYLPFLEALRLWVNEEPDDSLREQVGDGAAELAKLAPEIAARLGPFPAAAAVPAAEERLRLFDHVARFVQRLAERRGVLLFVDDLQWADQGTLALLHYLLRHLAGDKFLALATYREIELDRRHPLAAALVDWNRERLATRIALGRLSREDTDRMLAVMMGQDQVSPDFGHAIYGETEGNPFFVEEVVKSLIDQGQIYRGEGEWQRGEVADLSIPQSVKSAIGRRLDRLGEECTEVLRTAAGLGKVFEFEELAACAGLSEDRLLDALDEALAAQLVSSDARAFAFTHDKIREVLYEELNPVRRRRLHQRIGEGLEKLHAARLDAHAEDLAHHFSESGDLERGLRYALQAAGAARKVFAFEEALLFYQRARECAEGLGRTEALTDIDLAMGDCLDDAGHAAEAAVVFERVLEKTVGDEARADLASRIAKLYVDVGNARAGEFAEMALRDSSPERHPAAFALATAVRARTAHLRGRHQEALTLLTEAHRVAESIERADLLAEIQAFLAGACQHLARHDESDAWSQRLVESSIARGMPGLEAIGYEFQGENATWRGHARRAIELSDREIAIADRIHAADRRAWAMFVRGLGLHLLGRLADSDATFREGLDLCHRIGELRLANFVLSRHALVCFDRGDFEEGESLAAVAARESERMNLSFLRTEMCHVAARRALFQDDWGAILEAVAKARALRVESDAALNELELGPLVARALIELGRLDEARAAIDAARALTGFAGCDYFVALMLQEEARWLARREEYEPGRRLLEEAIARLDRFELRVNAARARLDRADVRRRAGDEAGARGDAEEAARTFEECGAVPDATRAREFLSART